MHDKIAEKIFNRFHNDVAGFCSAFTNLFFDVDGKKQEPYPLQVEFMNLSRREERIVSVVKCRQCVPGDTLIYTEDGPEYIKDLHDKNYRGKVYSYDGNAIVLNYAQDIWQTGEKKLIRIKVASGEEIKCTVDHKVYCNGSWERADEIQIGDILNVFEGSFGDTQMQPEGAIAMGYFITDGTYTNATPKFTNVNINYVNEFEDSVGKMFNVSFSRHKKGNGVDSQVVNKNGRSGRNKSEYAKYLIDLGMRSVKGADRILPNSFLNLNKENTALLLNRIFAGDGWYSISSTHGNEVGIGSQSMKFLYQVSFLLSKFGIHASILKSDSCGSNFYKLKFSKYEYVKKFIDEIGIFDKSLRRECKQTNVSRKSNNRVVKIEVVDGLHQTYDMTITNTHNYYANGILVHNSGFTTSIKAKAIHGAFFGKVPNFLIASASQLQATKVLREIKEAFRSMPEAIMPEFEKDTETELHLSSGPKLVSLPANPQTVRGFSGSVALDEFGVLNRKDSEALYEALLPTLVKGYNMVVVSTPKGKDNLFHDLCNPKMDDDGNVVGIRSDKIIRVHWMDVPHVKKAVLEMDLQNKMTKKSFLQEFCCEFVDDEDNSLFDADLIQGRFVDKGLQFVDAFSIEFIQGDVCPEKLVRNDIRAQYDSIFIGFDPAISFDGSCVSVWGVKDNEWVQLYLRILPKGMEVSVQCEYVSRLAQFFNATRVGLDATGGMGLAFLQRLRDTKIAHLLLPITFSSSLKTREYAEIKNKMQCHVMKSPEHHEMIKQFMSLNYNPVTGRIAAAGSWRNNHDDIPSAILCAHACRSKRNNSGFTII